MPTYFPGGLPYVSLVPDNHYIPGYDLVMPYTAPFTLSWLHPGAVSNRETPRLVGPWSPVSGVLLALCLGVLAGCGGGDATSQGSGGAAGVKVEEEFWDQAESILRRKATTRYGKYVGDYREWHQNGMAAIAGAYSDDGVKVGEWKAIYPNGIDQRLERFVDGELEGEVLEWHPDGSLAMKGAYASGKRVGEWETYYQGTEEAVNEQSTWEGDRIVGSLKVFYETGELRMEVAHVNGIPEGAQRVFYKNGELEREVNNVAGVPHGMETLYHEGGAKLGENEFVNGARTGEARSWWPNGTLGMVGRNEADQPVGLWQRWHPNGARMLVGQFEAGTPIGEWRNWYESGALERVAIYDPEGGATGEFLEWWPDGSRRLYAVASGGDRKQVIFDGEVFFWNEQGELDVERSGVYKSGSREGELSEEGLARAQGLHADPAQPEELELPDSASGDGEDQNG